MMGWYGLCDRLGRFGAGHMWGLGAGGGVLGAVGSLLGFLFFLGLLALFVLAAIWLIRRTQATSTAMPGELGLLRRRLAAGEITLEEYHRIREELRA
ncbi:MAG: hypothetical protein ACP5HS_14405 [Anaerolineae bacterium]